MYVATVYDLMTSQYGIKRFNHELEATSYDDAESKYTPAWQQRVTGIKPELVTQVARICAKCNRYKRTLNDNHGCWY